MHAPQSPLLNSAAWQNLVLEMLWVYRGIAPDSQHWSHEIIVPAGVFFVLHGAVFIETEGRQIDCHTGDAFFSAPSVRRQRFDPGTELLSVGFRAEWPQSISLFREGLNRAIPSASLTPLHQATAALFAAAHGARERISHRESLAPIELSLQDRCAREATFLLWFAEYTRTLLQLGITPASRPVARDPRVLLAQQRLDAWPFDQPFERSTLTQGLPIGARRLEQLFQAELSTTPHAYLERRRLEAARQRLAFAPTSSLKEIAFALGFRHPSHFTVWFRRLAGEAPQAFRDRSQLEGL